MNPLYQSLLVIFGSLMACVIIIFAVPYLAPYSGNASAGVVSTGTEVGNILPFVAVIGIGAIIFAAMSSRRG